MSGIFCSRTGDQECLIEEDRRLFVLANILVPTAQSALEPYRLSTHDDPPIVWVIANKFRHQLFALPTLDVDDFDASRAKVLFAAEEGLVLAYHHA